MIQETSVYGRIDAPGPTDTPKGEAGKPSAFASVFSGPVHGAIPRSACSGDRP